MKIFGLPLGDSGLYCIATNIFTPFCEPKIIPLVVDTGTSHTTPNPKGAYDLGITSTVMGMLSTEGATGIGQYALLHDCTRVPYEYGAKISRGCEGYPIFQNFHLHRIIIKSQVY